MPSLTQEQKDKIVARLKERGAISPCPRCRNQNFSILDGYFMQPISTEVDKIVIGGQTIPSVVLICTKCGYLSQHALGVLGLLPTNKDNKK